MPDPREALAAALAEQSPDDDDLRDWLTDRAEFVMDALAAPGVHLCTEGQAVVDGAVVTLVDVGMRVSAEQPDVARPMCEDEFSDYPTVPLFAACPQEEAPNAR